MRFRALASALSFVLFTPPLPPLDTVVALEDEPGFSLAGRVTDPTGAPLADVDVWVGSRSFRPTYKPAARTGADGRFALGSVGADKPVLVCRSGFLSVLLWPGPEAEPRPLVMLQPAARVSGRILDAHGRPLAGASASIRQLGLPSFICGNAYAPWRDAPCPMPSNHSSVETGADGRFLLAHLVPGIYRLDASLSGYLTLPGVHLKLPAGETPVGDLFLDPGAVLRGRVLDPEGRPLAGVHVRPSDDDRSRSDGTGEQSDTAGRYLLAGLEPGRRRLAVEDLETGLSVTQEAEILPGENQLDLVFSPPPLYTVRGRVTDEAGSPVGDAAVLVLQLDEWEQHQRADAPPAMNELHVGVRTAADGTFTLAVRDGLYELHVEAERAPPVPPQRLRIAGHSLDGIEFRLPRPVAVVVGRLTGWEGISAGGVGVSARYGRFPFSWRDGEVRADGRYRIDALGPGRWTVIARVDKRSAEAELMLFPGDHEVKLDIDFALTTVRGRVTGPDDAPLPNAIVGLAPIPDNPGHATVGHTDAEGAFALEVPSGTYRVSALHLELPGAVLEEPLRVADGFAPEVHLRLGAPARLVGTVTGLAPEELIDVHITGRNGPLMDRAWPDPAGGYTMERLGPGTWTVTARVGDRVARGLVTIEREGEEVQLDLRFAGQRLEKLPHRKAKLHLSRGKLPYPKAKLRFSKGRLRFSKGKLRFSKGKLPGTPFGILPAIAGAP